jgi:L-serine dehydratase
MPTIQTSLFELYKIGPGPSSSHTLGPMKAGLDFSHAIRTLAPDRLRRAASVRVHLFGSLSATGRGHGTDRAVLAGLLGENPETCSASVLDSMLSSPDFSAVMDLGETSVVLNGETIVFDALQHDFPYNNTLIISLLAADGSPLFTREYYSVGGGFLQWKGWKPPVRGYPVFPYRTMTELKTHLVEQDLRLHELVLANEQAITGATEKEIMTGLDRIISTMEHAVKVGISTTGILPGPIGLKRKAPILYERYRSMPTAPDRFLAKLSAYAFAVAEENAAGHSIVTAPTAGSAGVIPAIVYLLKAHRKLSRKKIREGLLAASVVAFLAKHNASIAGAEVGCQGEVGVASSMAAAMLAYSQGYRFQVTENAAESALEHHLGLTCDPIGGYVQIPCIERNAMGAVKAYNAFLIASTVGPDLHMIGLDQVICAMAETGKDMCPKYKETSLGGLAISYAGC